MVIVVRKQIERFIEEQLAKGDADPSEVARQAFLRWMEEEEFDADPPQLAQKLSEARRGKFHPYDSSRYDIIATSVHEASVEESDFIVCDVQDAVRYIRKSNP